jgi:nitrate/TMAO reductase-like tetraheme cytochrome c subunit
MMTFTRWQLVGILLVAALVGAGGIIVSTFANHYTSTEAFCSTSCHTMVLQAADPAYAKSKHRANGEGVQPSCADCHIPTDNWFHETYTHVTSGIRDVFVTLTHDFNDPKAWEARRAELEDEALATIRGWDSSTCRNCHVASAIHPATEDGRAAHEALQHGGVTCVDCHINIAHSPAAKPK